MHLNSDRDVDTPMPSPVKRRGHLLQVLGTWESAAIGIGVAIGAGIFRTPGYVAGFLDAPWKILAVWVIGGLLVLGDCLVLAELATRHPRAGGWFVYVEQGWGRFAAFVYGWAFILVVDPASSSALVVVLGEFLAGLFGLTPLLGKIIGIAVTLCLFGLSMAGVRLGSRVQSGITYLKLAALAGVGGLALLAAPGFGGAVAGGGEAVAATAPAASVGVGGALALLAAFGLALQGVLWTFDGYANTTTMTEEARDPGRTLPRALILGTLAVALVYLLVNGAYLHVLGRDGLAASQVPASDVASALLGSRGRVVFLLLAVVAALGSLNGAVLSAPRVAFALARSGLAPAPLARVSRVGTPDVATLWFALAWTLYAWFGSFEGLVSVAVFIGALANVLITAALFRIRRRAERAAAAGQAPPAGRIFLCPGYPWLPLILLLVWSGFSVTVLMSLGWKVGYGLALTALAAPVYWWLRRREAGRVRAGS